MNRHLTERELIEYRFKLASDRQIGETAEHLSGCAECREHLKQLNRKFAALDLLREDIRVSEGLVSQAVEQAKQPAPRKVIPFSKYPWIGVAAAVLVVGFVILIGSLTDKRPVRHEFARGSKSEDKRLCEEIESLAKAEEDSEMLMLAKGLDDKAGVPLGETWAMRDVARGKPAVPSAVDVLGVRKDLDSSGASRLAQQAKPEEGAFGPERGWPMEKEEFAAATKPVKELLLDQQARRSEYGFQDVREYGERLAGVAGGDIAKDGIPEQPPFAPASAIEIVVLPRRDKVQLTIYNSADLTLVRERRNLTLKKGWNWLQFMWANTLIDPTSLSLEPLEEKDKIDIQQLVFPARLRELGRWLIRSEVSGRVPFEITYFTSGLCWRAFYMGMLTEGEKTMRLQGYVRVTNNSGEDYENAQTRLIVGKVHILDQIAELAQQQFPYGKPGRPVPMEKSRWLREAKKEMQGVELYAMPEAPPAPAARKEIRKEGLSEYFLYTIEGTETIPTGWSKRLISFDVDEVPVVNLYKYEEERYGQSVVRFLSFKNNEEHELGDTPIPGGMLKVYRTADDTGHLSYTGQSSFKYIPVDEDVELNLGPVANVVVEPKLMDFKTEQYRFDNKGNISGWDETRVFKVEVRNTRDIGVKVEVQRNFSTSYWKLEKGGDFDSLELIDLDTVKFTLFLQPRSAKKFDYTLTTYHGVRQEDRTRALRGR